MAAFVKGAVQRFSSMRAPTIPSAETVQGMLIWDPVQNKFHRSIRDGAYMLIDFPKFVWKTSSSYGALIRYTRQARRNKGKVNPEDFKDVDTNELRIGLETFAAMKGPLQKIDFRWFYWMYLIMITYSCYTAWTLQKKLDAKLDRSGGSLEERRKMFANDYEEDVRPR
jgi:hypothetical protein